MADPDHIFNWRRVSPCLTTSGQPTEDELKAISNLGVSHVINLGMHDHPRALKDERATVTGLGMTYVHIPVAFDTPTESDFDAYCTAYSCLGDAMVHVHCIANLRVTAFLYRYDRDIRGVTDADARKTMDTVWQPGGVWAAFIGDEASVDLEHRPRK